jgi:hypothetical protein
MSRPFSVNLEAVFTFPAGTAVVRTDDEGCATKGCAAIDIDNLRRLRYRGSSPNFLDRKRCERAWNLGDRAQLLRKFRSASRFGFRGRFPIPVGVWNNSVEQ